LTGGFVDRDNGHPAVAAGDLADAAARVAVDLITGGQLRRVRSIRPPVLSRSSVGPPSLPS